MNLTTYAELRSLKGKKVKDLRHPQHPALTITSVTKQFIKMNNGGIKIITEIFLSHHQRFYELVNE